jgi:hypothetical protein
MAAYLLLLHFDQQSAFSVHSAGSNEVGERKAFVFFNIAYKVKSPSPGPDTGMKFIP